MIRPAISLLLALFATLASVFLVACGDDSKTANDGYRVTALFGNAFGVLTGQEVRIAGAKVGMVEDVSVTDQRFAAVKMRIDEAAFHNFDSKSTCKIRPQSVIGERFVECDVVGGDGTPGRELKVENGSRVLPASQTTKPVDFDLLSSVYKLPVRQRVTVILNDLGLAFAGNGNNLRHAIRGSIPALQETDQLLDLVVAQRQNLRLLTDQSDDSLLAFARNSERFSSSFTSLAQLQEAVNEKLPQLDQTLKLLPQTLEKLTPLLTQLDNTSTQTTPLLAELRRTATPVKRLLQTTGDFSKAMKEPFSNLGSTLGQLRGTLVEATGHVDAAQTISKHLRPLSKDADLFTKSYSDLGGGKRFLDFMYNSTLAANGFDPYGRFMRQALLIGACGSYVEVRDETCDGLYTQTLKKQGLYREPAGQAATSATAGGH